MNVYVLVTTIQQCYNVVSLEKDKSIEEKKVEEFCWSLESSEGGFRALNLN